MNKADIDFAEGQVNPGSIGDVVYAAFKSDIQAFPTISDDYESAADAEALACLTGNFTMKTGKVFVRLYNTTGEGNLTYDTVGEKDGKMFKNNLEMKYPKITDDIRAYAKFTVNTNVIYVVKHAGKFYLLGNADYQVETSTSGDTGKKPEDAHGITLNASVIDTTPLPRYLGTLPLADGSLNCETGVFTPSN